MLRGGPPGKPKRTSRCKNSCKNTAQTAQLEQWQNPKSLQPPDNSAASAERWEGREARKSASEGTPRDPERRTMKTGSIAVQTCVEPRHVWKSHWLNILIYPPSHSCKLANGSAVRAPRPLPWWEAHDLGARTFLGQVDQTSAGERKEGFGKWRHGGDNQVALKTWAVCHWSSTMCLNFPKHSWITKPPDSQWDCIADDMPNNVAPHVPSLCKSSRVTFPFGAWLPIHSIATRARLDWPKTVQT